MPRAAPGHPLRFDVGKISTMKYLQIILLLTILVGCVTTPNEPRINSPAKTLSSLGEGEKIAFVNLLTNHFYYSPRVNGPFDRREISYNQSVISMHSESFNAWEEVTRSFIDAPLIDLTEEFLVPRYFEWKRGCMGISRLEPVK
jgi:hypothetical protein